MKGLKHAALAVKDLKRALEFYESALGFTRYHVQDLDWAMLNFRETMLSLVPSKSSTEVAPQKQGFHPAHLGFCADNRVEVEERHKSLSQRQDIKVSKIEEHRDRSYGFYFSDTEGNQLEFIYVPVTPIFARPEKESLFVLWSHGSSQSDWSSALEKLQKRLQLEKPDVEWRLAFLERQSPSLEEVLQQTTQTHVNILPLFLGAGKHVKEDLPRQIEVLEKTFASKKLQLLRALCDHELFEAALSDVLQLICEDKR